MVDQGSHGQPPGTRSGVPPGAVSALLADMLRAPEPEGGSAWADQLQPGSVVGRFELVREIGRGGFGVVFEARDTSLGRTVAFKAVRAGHRAPVREDRLLREAEAAARLSHPNIVTLYDVGRGEHGPYLVLELLRGETLSQRLEGGPVPVPETLRIAVEVARGLAHAHARGVVHRDLTPGNVFLCEDGQVKLLDLGMAHAFGHPKLEGGTPAYMAPEQWRGAPEDERTDVFAFGVILHRMLTGTLPFPEDDGQAVTSARPAPALRVPEMPALADLVARMLSKDPVGRPRDAGAVLAALESLRDDVVRTGHTGEGLKVLPPRRVHAGARVAGVVALALVVAGAAWLWRGRTGARGRAGGVASAGIAVLPFADMSPGRDQEYFSDGLSEEIRNALARVDGLRVVGRTSSASFRERKATAPEIGRELGVGAVLDGSVRRSGTRLRITAQLVNTGDGYQIWAQEFDRELTDVFAVQDEISREVVQALQVKLLPGRAPTTREYRTSVPEAYNQYLLGRHAYNAGDLEGLRRAAEEFERAVNLDPGFAPGWAGLASALTGLAYQQQGPEPVAQLQERALHAANQAVELDPELPEAYAARGAIRAMVFWDWSAAQADFERALALQPRDGPTQRRYGIFILASQGRIPEAIAAVRIATEVDPLYPHAWGGLGMLQVANGEGEAGERSLRRALELAPRNTYATSWLVVANLLAGRPARALEAAGRIGDPIFRLHGKALAEHDQGNQAEARAALDALVAGHADGAAYQIAEVLAWWGEADQAFPWLERALRQRDAGLVHLKWDPLLRRLRGDPRFRDLLARMRLPVDGP